MESLLQVLIRRDGYGVDEARELIAELRERVCDGEDPEEILWEELGLEPDYVDDLLF
jgi:hypothetical protein